MVETNLDYPGNGCGKRGTFPLRAPPNEYFRYFRMPEPPGNSPENPGTFVVEARRIALDYGTFSLAPSYLHKTPWKDDSILQTLYKTGLALSSDPRDKVYTILNLASDGATLVPQPNYNLSTFEVYTRLVIRIIETTNRLDILSIADPVVYSKILCDKLPSWVPDFSQRTASTINSSISSLKPVAADGGASGAVELKLNSVGKKSNHSSPRSIRVRAILRLNASCCSGMDFIQSKYVPLRLKAN
jgi:hypothetical protein